MVSSLYIIITMIATYYDIHVCSCLFQHGYDHVYPRIANLPPDHPLRTEATGINVRTCSVHVCELQIAIHSTLKLHVKLPQSFVIID